MATDYGTDVAAVTDLPDPEQLASGEANVVRALARRLLTPTGTLEAIGDTEPYDSIDLRDYLGGRLGATELAELQQAAVQVLEQDPRVLSADVEAAYSAGRLEVTVNGEGTEGPFSFVLAVDDVTAAILRGS